VRGDEFKEDWGTGGNSGQRITTHGLRSLLFGLRSLLFAPTDLRSGMGKQQQEGKKEVDVKKGAQTKATAVKERCQDKGKDKIEKEFFTKKGTQSAATSGGKLAGGKTRCTDANREGKTKEPKEKEICVICQEVKRSNRNCLIKLLSVAT
jgi:hypothetical protein